jgi:hypothetical protein
LVKVTWPSLPFATVTVMGANTETSVARSGGLVVMRATGGGGGGGAAGSSPGFGALIPALQPASSVPSMPTTSNTMIIRVFLISFDTVFRPSTAARELLAPTGTFRFMIHCYKRI